MMRSSVILGLLALLMSAVPVRAQADPFIGEIEIVGFNFAPVGWATCDGQIQSIAQNTALFSLLGTTYGGDGVQTFALPDLRGRIAIGQGQGPGLAAHVVGERGGEEQVTLNLSQLPVHNHAAMGSSAPASALGPGGSEWATTTVFLYSSTGSGLVAMNSGAIGAVGGGQPFDKRPPYLVMNFIIALNGIFPSRD
jgi:microcystin-dependent protein